MNKQGKDGFGLQALAKINLCILYNTKTPTTNNSASFAADLSRLTSLFDQYG